MMNNTYENTDAFNFLVYFLPKCAPSSTQNIGKTTSGMSFIHLTSEIGFTSKLNWSRFAADNGVPVIYRKRKTNANAIVIFIKYEKSLYIPFLVEFEFHVRLCSV